MNLQPFCEQDPDQAITREWLLNPYSLGDWTYATDGRLIVRVPRRLEVPENPKAHPRSAEMFNEIVAPELIEVPPVVIPIVAEEDDRDDCEACDGRGTVHNCPSCHCTCRDCDGSGYENPLLKLSFGIGANAFSGKYIARIRGLPGLKISLPDAEKPMRFAFDGGDGILMPLRGTKQVHIVLVPTNKTAER